MRSLLIGFAAVAAAAAAAVVLNVLLLGYTSAQTEPVGRLNPATRLVPTPPADTHPKPSAREEAEREAADD